MITTSLSRELYNALFFILLTAFQILPLLLHYQTTTFFSNIYCFQLTFLKIALLRESLGVRQMSVLYLPQ